VSDDAQLLDAWRTGNQGAGDTLLERHFDAVLRFFRTKLGDEVEDLVQRTFLDCVESRDQVREDNFRAYLFGVARHRLIDHLRHKQRYADKTDFLIVSVADLGTSPSQRVARNQEQLLLLDALRRIPLDFQTVIELAYWEDLSGKEIAEVMGIGENTVRSRLARGRQMLREELERLTRSPERIASTLRLLDDK